MPMLKEDNFGVWSKCMKANLTDHDLVQWLTEDPSSVPEGAERKKAQAASERAKAKLACYVSDDLLDTVDACSTAKQRGRSWRARLAPRCWPISSACSVR